MPDRDTLVEASGVPTVDPWSKVINKLDSGALTVDGQVIDTPLPRWQHAMDAWKNHDVTRLQQLGVGVVVEDGVIVWQDPAAPRPRVPWILTALWLSAPLWIISGVALIHLGRGGPDRLVPQSGGRSHSTRNQRHKP
ncbi:MAG: hypothetical protein SOW59_09615, partial [Corynebacterium sp.]|nr:hypothetical protein [Corynebacterium sp.]